MTLSSIVTLHFYSWEEIEARVRKRLNDRGADPAVTERAVARMRGVFEKFERAVGLQKVHAADADGVIAAIERILQAQQRNVDTVFWELLDAVYSLESRPRP